MLLVLLISTAFFNVVERKGNVMYIHLGCETVVRAADIIGIFDIENTSVSKNTREYLAGAGKRNSAVTVSYDMPKSFIVAVEDMKERVYISSVSSASLIKRGKSNKI